MRISLKYVIRKKQVFGWRSTLAWMRADAHICRG